MDGTAWDVVLDVWPEMFAWGVIVIPKGIAVTASTARARSRSSRSTCAGRRRGDPVRGPVSRPGALPQGQDGFHLVTKICAVA